ncbi:MAG: protoheme IX farnesyltransferase [Planctomycetota bacterium]
MSSSCLTPTATTPSGAAELAPGKLASGKLAPADLRAVAPSGVSPAVISSVAINPSSVSEDDVAVRAASNAFADLVTLTKPRIVTMILVTTIATGLIGGAVSGLPLSGLQWFALLVGTAGVAASAGAANQVWERRRDSAMERTAKRPLPSQRLGLSAAIAMTAATGLLGTLILLGCFGLSPAAWAVGTWVLYVLVYTPMKVRTSWNTTVGAVAGAMPVMIGFTAAGAGDLHPVGWLLFAILAAWQYPHFMAIAWLYRHQYAGAGFVMTTTTEPTGRHAAIQSIVGSLVLMGVAVTACCVTGASIATLSISIVSVLAASWPMLKASIGFARVADDVTARKLLRSSLLVLPITLAVLTTCVLW